MKIPTPWSRVLVRAALSLPLLVAACAAPPAPATAPPLTIAPPPNALPAGKATILADILGTELELFTYKPASYRGEKMLFVLHGVLRNADEYRDDACALADRHGLLVVAPRFDTERFPSRRYQRGGLLDSAGRAQAPAQWTYAFLPAIAAEIRTREGLPALPFWVIGHSAGGQFVARMSAFQTTGAVRHVAANAGSHLFPTRDLPFGYGFGGLPEELADDDTLQRYLAAPLTLYQGTADAGPDDYFDTSESAMRQGAGRYQRGKACFEQARALAKAKGWAFAWRLVEAEGIAHDHQKMFDHDACGRALFGD